MATAASEHGEGLPEVGSTLKVTIGAMYQPTPQMNHRFPGDATTPQLRFYTRFIATHRSDALSDFLAEELAISTGLSKEFCYVTDHIDISQQPPGGYTRGSLKLGAFEARRKPIAAWVKDGGAFTQDPTRPAIVIFGGKPTDLVSYMIEAHYTAEGSRRWDRLSECLPWIYLDLFYIFTNWDSTLEVARFNVEAKEQEMFNRRAITPIVQQTRELHRDTATTLALQEGLRLHQASIKRFQRGLRNAQESKEVSALQIRMEYVSELLEFYETTCLTILEQQRNLLNLTFNLETVTQSRAVTRLNVLAIFFLPISFVASIFGITTMEAPAYWYPVAAVPTLVLTAGVAFVLARYSTENRHDTDRHSKPSQPFFTPRISKRIYAKPSLRKRRDSTTSIGTDPPRPSQQTQPPPTSQGFTYTGTPEPAMGTVGSTIGPAVVVNDIDQDDDVGHLTTDRYERNNATSSHMQLGFRVTGVARVSTNHLSPDPWANAAPGALNSPSGSLRHN
ncbi:nucleoside diphosphate kinase Ndk1 [Hypoxylon texense]